LHAMMEVESGTIVTDLYVAYETSEPSIWVDPHTVANSSG
jgi:hypothetical protein